MAEHHKIGATKRAAARKAALNESVDGAMRAIVEDMKANEGIYPHNGGAVSMAELARRADIHESSFYKKQNVELKERANLWLQQLQKRETIGRKRVRKHLKEVASDWKARYEAIDRDNIVTHLKLQQVEAENLELKHEVAELQERLRVIPTNVSPIRGKAHR